LKHLNGHWRPSKRQLEVLADCACAGLDAARTAALLGIDEPTFAAWARRLAAGARLDDEMLATGPARPVPDWMLRPI
jgi:hypothetical protein